MTPTSPLLSDHQSRDALLSIYGDADTGAPIVQTFGQLDIEYAALRKHCVLFDAAHRGALEITGPDRLSFLDAMITQRVRDLPAGTFRDSFWLNRKGRIIADLRLIELPDRMLIDLDTLVAAHTAETLGEFLFSEDVTITNRSDQLSRLWLLGPTAPLLLTEATASPNAAALHNGQALESEIDAAPVVITRSSMGDTPMFELTTNSTDLPRLYTHLLSVGQPPHTEPDDAPPDPPASRIRLRPSGWHAINIARIESGLPMFNIDFASTNLPAETSLLDARVDFKKGCYIGQEIVARMHARGHSKLTLVALRVEGEDADSPPQAETGTELFNPSDPEKPVGAVTSSAISPMLSGASICFALVRPGSYEAGTQLILEAQGRPARALVQPTLQFWPPGTDA